jgi:hypothetical protein
VIVAVFIGTVAGFGCLGVHWAFRVTPPPLEAVAAAVSRPYDAGPGPDPASGLSTRVGLWFTSRFGDSSLARYGRWTSLRPCWAITGDSPERTVSRSLLLGGIGLLSPPLLWMAGSVAGLSFPVDAAIVMSLVAVPSGLAWPVLSVVNRARGRRHHCRVILGSFVDLVVLGLAGGVGVEGALFAASQVSSDWAAKRMARTLAVARDVAGARTTRGGDRRRRTGRALGHPATGRHGGCPDTPVAERTVRVAAATRAGRCRVGGQCHDGTAVHPRSVAPHRIPALRRLPGVRPDPRGTVRVLAPNDARSTHCQTP